MSERIGVAESDLAAELGLDRVALKRRRDGLDAGEWWKGGPTKRTIFWSTEAAERLRDSMQEQAPSEPDGEVFEAVVARLPRNPYFVEVALNGECHPVLLCKRGKGRPPVGAKMLKKTIKVRRNPDGSLEIAQ